MKYTYQKIRTVYEDIEVEVPEGISHFKTFNEDGEDEYFYKLDIRKDINFQTLYNISITKMQNYDDDYFVRWWEICDDELPYKLRDYFCEGGEKYDITEEEFNSVKKKILNKL